jgi:hypothetical protein
MKRASVISVFVIFLNISILAQINDIKSFLNQCPSNDPAIDTILKDFEIRLNGTKVLQFPCTEPVSSMYTEDYTNPLIYLQTLRVIYYMDKNIAGPHLPWTDTTLYVWMKDRVDGVNIKDGVIGGYCCEEIEGKKFFVTGNPDAFNREFDKYWRGIAGNIDFFAHEVRHTDGSSYYHTSCCGIAGGCDDSYNVSDLGAYGIQYWLNKSWLTGYLYVGARTSHSESEINDIISWHLSSMDMFRSRFCNNVPAAVTINDITNPLSQITGLTENHERTEIKLFPNPLTNGGELNISIPNTEINKMEIISISGVLLQTVNNKMLETATINELNLKPGIYFIKIQTCNNKVFYEKLIIR